jgi:allantoinase
MTATAAFLELGAATGAHVHIVHISAPRGYEMVSRYRADGVNATAELCVHYLHFDNGRDVGRLGARMKVSPPIRAGMIDGLWDCLADDQVEFISSDHSSWPIDNKLVPSIFDAGAGIPGLETLAPSFYTDALTRGISDPLRLLVEQLCERPARFFGLGPQKGSITIGADADFAILELGSFPFDASASRDGLNWSPYDGETFAMRVATTILRGDVVWDGTAITSSAGQGTFVARPPAPSLAG